VFINKDKIFNDDFLLHIIVLINVNTNKLMLLFMRVIKLSV